MMKNNIKGLINVDWLNIQPLQPHGIKIPFNYEHLKNSFIKYGFTVPFAVWIENDITYVVNGHQRIDLLMNMKGEGFEVPDLLPAYEIKAKNRKEAIEILIDCYNMRENPFSYEALEQFIQVEEVDVAIETINVKVEDVVLDEVEESESEAKEDLSNMIAVSLTDEESILWLEVKEKIGKLKDKNAIFELINYYKNENNIN